MLHDAGAAEPEALTKPSGAQAASSPAVRALRAPVEGLKNFESMPPGCRADAHGAVDALFQQFRHLRQQLKVCADMVWHAVQCQEVLPLSGASPACLRMVEALELAGRSLLSRSGAPVKTARENASGSLPKANTSVSMPAGRVRCKSSITLPATSSGGSQRLGPARRSRPAWFVVDVEVRSGDEG